MIKNIKKAIKIAIIVSMVFITIFNVYNIINTKVLGNDLTVIDNRAILEVASGSMEPTLKVGDLIVIRTDKFDFQPGDIITYKDSNGSFITHRIITISNNEVITKGDANNTVDKPILLDDIVGKYVFKYSYLGNILGAFRNTSTLIIVLVMGTIICFVLSLNDAEEKDREEELRKEKEFEERMNTQPIKTLKVNTNKTVKKTTPKKVTSKKEEIKKPQVKKKSSKKEEKKEEKVVVKKATKPVVKKTTTKKVAAKPVAKKTSTKKGTTKKVNK